ncbi:MAG: cell division protein ZapA [Ideonella sp.]|nr:cell division protein ZapA [Ideonella sp.]
MKQLEVTIMGQSYVLACPDDGEDALLAAVARVDREMCAIRDAGRVRARERIAVLAALNLAYAQAEAPTAAPAGDPGPTSRDIDALIEKIDQAIAADGQLI